MRSFVGTTNAPMIRNPKISVSALGLRLSKAKMIAVPASVSKKLYRPIHLPRKIAVERIEKDGEHDSEGSDNQNEERRALHLV